MSFWSWIRRLRSILGSESLISWSSISLPSMRERIYANEPACPSLSLTQGLSFTLALVLSTGCASYTSRSIVHPRFFHLAKVFRAAMEKGNQLRKFVNRVETLNFWSEIVQIAHFFFTFVFLSLRSDFELQFLICFIFWPILAVLSLDLTWYFGLSRCCTLFLIFDFQTKIDFFNFSDGSFNVFGLI